MKVLTIQSKQLETNNIIYADTNKCNHKDALPVYKRLFNDYNQKKQTEYKSFFWGFSDLLVDDEVEAIERAYDMTGLDKENTKVLFLDIPDELCLETDFYNFTDEVYAQQYPNELESIWESVYENRKSEKQVIFPYISSDMIFKEIAGMVELKLLDGTNKIEEVNAYDFGEAYVRINFMQCYNNHEIEEFDTYYALSAPSPTTGFKGVHNTLVLEKSDDLDLNDLLYRAIQKAIEYGFKQGKARILEKIGEVEYVE